MISSILFFLAGYVNQVPWYDDKAYLNNALIHSGIVRKEDVVGPYAEERPPLFWWILTTLFSVGFPIVTAKFLSPFFGVILVVVTGLFARKLFQSDVIGFLAGLFLSFNAFFLLISGMILTDVPGTLLATLFLLCVYVGVNEKRDAFLVASGPLLALSLMMREQNLIFIPIAIFYVISRLRILGNWNTVLALFCSVLPGLPVLAFGLIPTLTMASNLLTPLISNQVYAVPFTSVGISIDTLLLFVASILVAPMVLDSIRSKRVRYSTALSAFLGLVFFAVVLYPYLWDNYLLGASFQIQGKGILSRWVSHEVMSETIGMGVQLTPWARRWWWLSRLPALISPAIFMYSLVGLTHSVKKRMLPQLTLLLPWIAYTAGFTVFFSYLEARFFIPAIPPLAILSAVGLVKTLDWVKLKLPSLKEHAACSYVVEVGIVVASFLLTNLLLTELILPTKVGSLTLLDLATRAYVGNPGWFSSYSMQLSTKLMLPHLNLDLSYVLESLLCLVIVVIIPVRILQTVQHEAAEDSNFA